MKNIETEVKIYSNFHLSYAPAYALFMLVFSFMSLLLEAVLVWTIGAVIFVARVKRDVVLRFFLSVSGIFTRFILLLSFMANFLSLLASIYFFPSFEAQSYASIVIVVSSLVMGITIFFMCKEELLIKDGWRLND